MQIVLFFITSLTNERHRFLQCVKSYTFVLSLALNSKLFCYNFLLFIVIIVFVFIFIY